MTVHPGRVPSNPLPGLQTGAHIAAMVSS